MTFVNVGILGAAPGKRDELDALLTERNESHAGAGCRAYEIGVNDD
ncbi:hypothetical protein SOM11_13790 [Frigoribacterium sp. CFBP9039]|nr:hypothetical protein [Frigoribacterium sp. CFBP9039]MDY0947064.1 hypothetical protein [Frigoribacterium sp. CFBP9039]